MSARSALLKHPSRTVIFGSLFALSACGSPSSPGLTSADIPSYLGVTTDSSATAAWSNRLSPPHGCKKAGVAVFTVPGKPLNSLLVPGPAHSPAVISMVLSCATTSQARQSFATAFGASVSGFGNEAKWLNKGVTPDGDQVFAIAWRKDRQLGTVLVAGPVGDTRIGPGLTESLARRAVAKS